MERPKDDMNGAHDPMIAGRILPALPEFDEHMAKASALRREYSEAQTTFVEEHVRPHGPHVVTTDADVLAARVERLADLAIYHGRMAVRALYRAGRMNVPLDVQAQLCVEDPGFAAAVFDDREPTRPPDPDE